MSFVKETLPNLIIRPLLDPYRYKHTRRQGFPLMRHEQAVLQHNDDERWLTFPVPSCLALWSGGDLSESLVKEGKCVLLVTRVSPPWNVQTVVCLSPIFFLVQRNHSNLPLLPPFFFEVSSLSLYSPFHFFFIPQCQGFHTENTSNNKDKYLPCRACFHSPEQHGHLFAAFFFLSTKVSEYSSLKFVMREVA